MAPTDDCSATATPAVLITITAVLLVVRLLTWIAAAMMPVEQVHTVFLGPATYRSILPSAKGKLVIYEFYAQWSDPCKRMEQSALSNSQITDMLKRNFLPLRITDVAHEKGKNPEWISNLERRYRIFALPTLVVVQADGEPVGSLIGNCSSLTTYRFLSRSLYHSLHG